MPPAPPRTWTRRLARAALGLAVSAIALWLTLRGRDLGAIWRALVGAEYRFLPPFFAFLVLIYLARVVRWGLLLGPTARVPFARLNAASAVGFMAILVLPFRLGEVVRPYLVADGRRLHVSTALASVVVERVIDGLFTALLLLLALLAVPAGTPGLGLVRAVAVTVLLAFAAVLGFLVLAYRNRAWAGSVAHRLAAAVAPGAAARLSRMADAFLHGLRLVPGRGGQGLILALTACYWGMSAYAIRMLARGFGFDLSAAAACTVLGVLVVGVMIPAAPGMVGTTQAAVVLGLSIFAPREVVDAQGTAFANVLWAAQLAFQVALGLPFLWSRHVRLRGLLRIPAEAAEALRVEEAEGGWSSCDGLVYHPRPVSSRAAAPSPSPAGVADGQADGQVAACPLCGGGGEPSIEKAGYRYHSCSACRTLFLHPVPPPEALAAYYRDPAAEQKSRFSWEQSHRHAHRGWRRALEEAARLAGPGPLLDVGCGAGQFLSFARALGFEDLAGVELSPEAAEAARRATGATVHGVDLLRAPLPSGHFAAVTLWDVLEHLADPRRALRRVAELLRPGGVVVIATPNRGGITLRALGSRTLVVTPPEHLFLASRPGLAGAVAAEGFLTRRLEASDLYLKEWVRLLRREDGAESAGAGQAGARALAGDGRRSYVRLYEWLTALPVFPALHSAANAVLRATRLGDQLLALAQKPPSVPIPPNRRDRDPPG